jgi:DNA invertase Pin-like site-specific DNA recombinase
MKKYIGYYRLSKKKTSGEQYGLRSQRRDTQIYVKNCSGVLVNEFSEYESATGKKVRPVLDEALRECEEQDAVLIVARLDRLTRSVHFLSCLQKSKVQFIALDFPEANPLVLNIMVSVAEFEAVRIRERVVKGLEQARREGKRLGASKKTLHKATRRASEVRSQRASRFRQGIREEIEKIIKSSRTELTNQMIADRLNRKRIQTRRGSIWYPESVRRVLAG